MRTQPQDWTRHDVTRDGTRVFLRPLRPEDAALYPDFFSEIDPEDLRLRFFAPVRALNETVVSQLVNIDYETAMAFAALDETSGQLLGVVRLHIDPDRQGGEYAVIIRSRLKGHGLGWLLMQRIIAYAKAEGLKRIHGDVLTENVTMLAMCAELGFEIKDEFDSHGVKAVTLHLDGEQREGASTSDDSAN